MKRIKILLLSIIGLFMFPLVVNASSASINVSGTSSVVVGNQVSITVTLNSGSKMGSWQLDLNYDKSMLKLNSSSAEGGGTYMVNSSSSGTKSKSYTFKFTALKSGSTKISTSGAMVYDFDTLDAMSVSNGSKNVRIMTQSELEATYSSDANLKSLSVEGYEINPVFNKSTLEYYLEVENEIDKVTIIASKNDSNATVDGTGEKELTEGLNKVEINVTAQKGNKQTYVINITRKELNPIYVTLNSKQYAIVRRADQMPEITGYEATTAVYEETEIPSLFSSVTEMMLVGLKDEEGNVSAYILDNGKIKDKYLELQGAGLKLYPLELKQDSSIFSDYLIKKIELEGKTINAYALKDDSKNVIIYAKNLDTNKEGYFAYDIDNNIFSIYSSELGDHYKELMQTYKYIIYGLLGFILLLFLIIIFRKPKNKKYKYDEFDTTEIKELKVTEDKQVEEVEDKPTKNKKEIPIDDSTVAVSKTDILSVFSDDEEEKDDTIEVEPIEEVSNKEKKKLIKEEKRAEKLRKKEEKKQARIDKKRKKDFDF